MSEFYSLSDVIRKQIQDSNDRRDSLLNIQSTLALTLGVAPSQKNRVDPESDALTWGVSKWGVAKVTSQEKPIR